MAVCRIAVALECDMVNPVVSRIGNVNRDVIVFIYGCIMCNDQIFENNVARVRFCFKVNVIQLMFFIRADDCFIGAHR